MATISEKLRRIRKSLGLNQTQMATNVVSSSFYSRIENDVSRISTSNLVRLLLAHDQSVVVFLGEYNKVEPRHLLYERRINYAFARRDVNELRKMKEIKGILELAGYDKFL